MRKSPGRNGKLIVHELRERRNSAGFNSLTFTKASRKLTPKEKKELEKELQDRFHNWWDSWVAPLIGEVESRIVKERKK